MRNLKPPTVKVNAQEPKALVNEAKPAEHFEPDRPEVESPKEKKPFPFADRNTTAKMVADPALDRIVEHVFKVDLWGEFKELETSLKVGEKRTDYSTLMKALDEAEDNARRAHKLFCNAELERKRVNLEADTIEAAMRSAAMSELNKEKLAGIHTKQITDADVLNRCATMFAEEWKELQDKRQRYKLVVEHIGKLADLWFSRCTSLQTMVKKQR